MKRLQSDCVAKRKRAAVVRFQAFYRFFLQKFGQCTVFLKRMFYFVFG